MSPPGKTSLIVEIPCQQEDSLWSCDDDTVIQIVRSHFLQLGWIEETEILDASVTRLYDAYPILELGCEERLEAVFEYLRHFSNLKISGRMGKFVYAWIHDMIRLGKEIIEEYIRK